MFGRTHLCACVGSPGMSMPDFDNQTLAALRGRMVRYLMRSREVRKLSEKKFKRSAVLRYHICERRKPQEEFLIYEDLFSL